MSKTLARIIAGLEALPTDSLQLSRLLAKADSHHVLGQLAAQHMTGDDNKLNQLFSQALVRTSFDHRMLVFEMNRIERAVFGADLTPVLLKGATYVATNSQAAKGRRVSDIDILVDVSELEAIEAALQDAGWEPDDSTANSYDQAYYREHMHELPPLRHRTRGTIIDVHHQLLPKTARYVVDHTAMKKASVSLPNSKLKVFQPVDVFIHSCVHAFADGALDTPLRTSVELYYLFKDLRQNDLDTLPELAKSRGAARSVALGCWLVAKVFGERAASDIQRKIRRGVWSVGLKWAVLSKLEDGVSAPLAKFYMYIRSHYLRMPLHLLIPHLARKALNWRPASSEPVEIPFPKV